ncbi:MAG TPA: polysaccharide biosynthesis tyrosine autokinase [Acidimicrobiales bacterium]
MDLQQYLHAVRTYWWAVALPVVLGVAFGVYAASQAESEYRAAVTFFVATSTETDTQAAVQGDEFAQRRVNSYLELLRTDRLATKVIEESGLDLTPGQVKAMMGADSDVDTVLLTATVTHPEREVANEVAEAVATEFVELVDEVENQGPGPSSVHLEVVSGPSVTELPPRRVLAVGIPGSVGLVIGLGIAWLLELRDKTIRSETQLGALHPVPVLGMIPLDRSLRDAPRNRHQLTASTAGTESFRQLRTNLDFIDVDSPVQVVVVTSSVAGEGKTTTVTNLAAALVAARRRVLIVEADLRRPSLNGFFGAEGRPGLTDVLVGRIALDAALLPVVTGLALMPSGQLPPNPSELLGTEAMEELLDELRGRFDSVIIDTPPLLPVTDAAVLSAHSDGVLVVVRSGKTTRHQLLLAMRSLQAVGARVLGTVLNGAPSRRDSTYSAYWRAGQGPDATATGAPETARPATRAREARRTHYAVRDGEARHNGGPPLPTAAYGEHYRDADRS